MIDEAMTSGGTTKSVNRQGGSRSRVGAAALGWWRDLQPSHRGKGGDRAALAQLRRAATPTEILLLPPTINLWRAVGAALGRRPVDRETEAVAIVAGALANLRPEQVDTRLRFAEVLGRKPDRGHSAADQGARMSAARFAVLMRAESGEERLRQFRRAVALLDGAGFDLAGLAQDVFGWDERTRRNWIFQYYQQGQALRPSDPSDTEGGRIS